MNIANTLKVFEPLKYGNIEMWVHISTFTSVTIDCSLLLRSGILSCEMTVSREMTLFVTVEIWTLNTGYLCKKTQLG